MNSISIEQKISINSNKLDSNITGHIAEKLLELKNKCDHNYGYIIDIDTKKINILDNVISNSEPNIFFTVKFRAQVFKPKIEDNYEGIVCILFPHGILVDVMNRIKVLIPSNKMKGYAFNSGIFCKGDKIIKKDDNIIVKINMIKYEKQNFNCIGELYEEN